MRKSAEAAGVKRSAGGISRRGFGRLLAAAPAAATAVPQTLSREEELRAANQRLISSAQSLAKFDLAMPTEPAFVFRPL